MDRSTGQLIGDYYADVPLKREMGENETFFSNRKARELLGFEPRHDWRDHLAD